jgi:hypothetical protein
MEKKRPMPHPPQKHENVVSDDLTLLSDVVHLSRKLTSVNFSFCLTEKQKGRPTWM